jgi:PAS domain S-box-containing protein
MRGSSAMSWGGLPRWWWRAGALVLVAALYFGCARLGLALAVARPGVAALWPASGLALALLLRYGPGLAGGIWLGAFAGSLSVGRAWPAALVVSLGNTFEPVAAALLLRRLAGFDPALRRVRDGLALAGAGAAAGAGLAVAAAVTLWRLEGESLRHAAEVAFAWWTGDALGVLVVAPLVLVWLARPLPRLGRRRGIEAAVLLVALAGLGPVLLRGRESYAYAVFPLVGWAALRFGPRGAATASALVATQAIGTTVAGAGPFFTPTPLENLFAMQTFLGLLALTGLVLGPGVAEHRRTLLALARSERRFRQVFEHAGLGIAIFRPDGRIERANPALERMLGYAGDELGAVDVIGAAFDGPRPAPAAGSRDPAGAATAAQVTRPYRRKDGSVMWGALTVTLVRNRRGEPAYGIGLLEDVTERRVLDEQLRQAQKMEALGQLTAGIAHDFNNLLTVILSNAALLEPRLVEAHPELAGELRDLQWAARQGAELVSKLLLFSRRRPLELRAVDLAAVVADSARTLARVLPETIALELAAGDRAFPVRADVGALDQMLLNLATNARDAMPEGGVLRIAVREITLDEDHLRRTGWGRPGRYAELAVSDTGAGMDPETRARVFEPFFTTKEPGRGTGLGMAMVFGLVRQHEGYIELESERGRGTTVRILLPLAPALEAAGAAPGGELPRGTERILLVEDEPEVRRATTRVLEQSGYRVRVAADGEEALALLAAEPGGFDLVVTDMVMPRLGGAGLYAALRERGVAIPVLFVTGYAPEELRETRRLDPGADCIAKPWALPEFLRRVRRALDRPGATSSPPGSGTP